MRMRLDMMLGGFVGMMIGLEAVAVRDVRVVAGEVMFVLFVVLGGFAMMLGGLFVMVGGGLMMLGFVQGAHFFSPERRLEPRMDPAGPRCQSGDIHMKDWRISGRDSGIKTNVYRRLTAEKLFLESRGGEKNRTISSS